MYLYHPSRGQTNERTAASATRNIYDVPYARLRRDKNLLKSPLASLAAGQWCSNIMTLVVSESVKLEVEDTVYMTIAHIAYYDSQTVRDRRALRF